MKNKRGSHAGFAISFVIFIAFIIFVLNIISPSIQVDSSKESLSQNVQESILEESITKIKEISVKPEYKRPSENCLKSNSIKLWKNYTAKNQKGNILNSNSTHIETSRNNFTKIYTVNISLKKTAQPSCYNSTSKYESGIVKQKEIVSKQKLVELIGNYSNDYSNIKSNLNIPETNEFEFIFVLENGTRKNATLQNDPRTQIFAKSEPIVYINKNATKKHGTLETRVW
ncbi:MAG: hypothetical protein ABEI74_03950 [Candidatus Pacearchaeota archaeon]